MSEQWKRISPADPELAYCGRIDFENKEAPVFVYACSSVRFVTDSKTGKIDIENKHSYFENSVGLLVDGECKAKLVLKDEGITTADLTPYMDGEKHEYTIYKRMDACHYYTFLGLELDREAHLYPVSPAPTRKIEVYGDSVSAGEVSEAEHCVASPDPEGHNGIYSNSFYSYSWMTARKLGAQIHDIAQGGIALMDGYGYFNMPDAKGMLSRYDKIQYQPSLGATKDWDFEQYTPQVVIVAIGQNDNHPIDYMAQDYEGEDAKKWRAEYLRFIRIIQDKYPGVHVVLTTTILGHDVSWDKAIDQVCRDAADDHVHHFLYEKNGCGTPGHIRKSEAEKMSDELSAFIQSLNIAW